MLKVGVMVSGGGTNLQAIIDGVHSGVITNAKLEVVISNKKDAYALTRAKENGIKAESVCIKDYATRDEFNKALIGIIPSFCGNGFYGLHVHEKALERGVKITGATVHFVDEGTDTGPIIYQKAVEVLEGDTPEILQKRVMEQAEWKILPQAINDIANGKIAIGE